MSWYINKDHVDGDYAVDAWNGSGNLDYVKQRCTHKFRMYDDDGELYYEGCSDDDSSFDPLDDFGMPNAGCTEIKYWNGSTWEIL